MIMITLTRNSAFLILRMHMMYQVLNTLFDQPIANNFGTNIYSNLLKHTGYGVDRKPELLQEDNK